MYFLNDSLCANICRKIDWSTHDLGPMENWPSTLKTTLSIMFQNPTPMLLFWGPQFYCFYNDSYNPMLGYVRSADAMALPGPIYLANRWETIGPQIKRVLSTQETEVYKDLPLKISRDGNITLASWSYTVSPLLDENGYAVATLTTCIETTETVKNDRELQEKETRLNEALVKAKLAEQMAIEANIAVENANAAKSAFLANMSHELRTPLGAIMGFSQLALEKDASNEDRDKYLAVMKRNSHQVLRIVDDILDLAKVEAGKVVIEPIEIDLANFLNDFVSSMSFRANENGIGFFAIAESALPEKIISDPSRLRQILMNSVGNAIKFTSNGFVRLQVSYKDGKISFVISDTGRGISLEQAEHLFQPFIQADPSTTRKFGGTGLGLIITRKLCQILGGTYSLEQSELGKGSTFNATVAVKLPAGANIVSQGHFFSKGPSVRRHYNLRNQFKGTKVLIVEDCLDNQDLLKILLDQHGVKFDLAENGREGADLALKNDYDLLLMDIQMPVMDGHQAVRYLRSKNYKRPIIALTAHAMKEEAHLAKKSGFTEYLSKPITRESLVTAIERYRQLEAH
jgi:signal transduction histidine kinase/CheY-like chemotaxis protein